jgi:nicotinamidase-related amidase
MSSTSHDLHGNAPDKAATALLLIDVINDLEFDEGEAMLAAALAMADKIAALKTRCQQAGLPAIYVNDNFEFQHAGRACPQRWRARRTNRQAASAGAERLLRA